MAYSVCRVPSAKLPARAASLRRKASAALMAASGSERGLGSFTTVAPAAVAAGEFGERQVIACGASHFFTLLIFDVSL